MKNILVVAAECSPREAVTDTFRIHCDEFSLLMAEESSAAIDCLKRRKADLLLIALRAQALDEFGLLAYVASRHPRLPVMLVSARAKKRPSIKAPFRVPRLPMPLESKVMVSRVRKLLEERIHEPRPGVTLPGLLELLHEERVTCGLHVGQGALRGRLQVLSGELVHARCGRVAGDAAALQVLSWPAPWVVPFEQPRDLPQTLQLRTNRLLALLAAIGSNTVPGSASPEPQKSLPRTYDPPPGSATFAATYRARPWAQHANHRLNWWDKKPSAQWRWWALPEKPSSK